jgi:hypothetical protein
METLKTFSIIDEEVQDFIHANENVNIQDLPLKKSKDKNTLHWAWNEIATQIEGRKKMAQKIPSWYHKKGIITTKLALEQCSSEQTAQFKAEILGENECVIDVTGGFGVDTYFFAQKNKNILHIEPNPDLQAIVKHNFKQLACENVTFFNENAEFFLKNRIKENSKIQTAIYIDPSRRDEKGNKVFQWKDLSPHCLELWEYLEKIPKILIKTSPLLDLSEGIKYFPIPPQEIFVVGTKHEVKEVLLYWENEKNTNQNIKIQAITLLEEQEKCIFSFEREEEKKAELYVNLPQKFLYEPYPSILKAGAFKLFAQRYNLKKLHIHSHLYTSETLENHIPVRIFQIENTCNYDKKALQKIIPTQKANITARNFVDDVPTIRKKLQLKEGGEVYIFATKNCEDNYVLLVCQKVN